MADAVAAPTVIDGTGREIGEEQRSQMLNT